MFFIDSSSRELETLIEFETQEVNRIGAELTIIYDRLKSARSMTGREELSKMHAVKPTSRTGMKKRVIELSNSNFKNNIVSIEDLENISTLSYHTPKSTSQTDFTTVGRGGSSAGMMDSPVSLDIDDDNSGYLERQSSFSSTSSTQQGFSRPPPPPLKSSNQPPPPPSRSGPPPPPNPRRFN